MGDLLGCVEWEGEKKVWSNIQKAARNEGPAAAACLRRGGGACQLLTLFGEPRFEEQDGMPFSRCGRSQGWTPIVKDLRGSALS